MALAMTSEVSHSENDRTVTLICIFVFKSDSKRVANVRSEGGETKSGRRHFFPFVFFIIWEGG